MMTRVTVLLLYANLSGQRALFIFTLFHWLFISCVVESHVAAKTTQQPFAAGLPFPHRIYNFMGYMTVM